MTRTMTLALLVVLPGGLLVLVAWVLAATVAEHMRHHQGPGARRFALAVGEVRWRDVWSHTRRSFFGPQGQLK